MTIILKKALNVKNNKRIVIEDDPNTRNKENTSNSNVNDKDTYYLKAVEDGDMETAQKMVDEGIIYDAGETSKEFIENLKLLGYNKN